MDIRWENIIVSMDFCVFDLQDMAWNPKLAFRTFLFYFLTVAVSVTCA